MEYAENLGRVWNLHEILMRALKVDFPEHENSDALIC